MTKRRKKSKLPHPAATVKSPLPYSAMKPGDIEVIREQAHFYSQNRDYQSAQNLLNQVLLSHGQEPCVWNDLAALCYIPQQQWNLAKKALEKALQLQPGDVDAIFNLGLVYQLQGQLHTAINHYQHCLALDKKHLATHQQLGAYYFHQKQYDLAIEHYETILKQSPQNSFVWGALGTCYWMKRFPQKTIVCYEQALQYDPANPVLLSDLSNALCTKGQIQAALDCCKKALANQPESYGTWANLLFDWHYLPNALPESYYAACQAFSRLLQTRFAVLEPTARAVRPLIRIGYLSPDFRQHAAYGMIESILSQHDRTHFELVCFADVKTPDMTTVRFYGYADEWYFTAGLTDQDCARLVQQCRVDVLVELGAGHTANNRLRVFAQRPAPVQISLFPISVGVPHLDYYVTDQYMLTEAEKLLTPATPLVRESSFLCFVPPKDVPVLREPPYQKNGFITFGSFNNTAKINDEVVALWAEILKQVPHSRLLLKYKSFVEPAFQDYFYGRFETHGIERERLQLLGWVGTDQRWELYNEMDVALDPFPFNGNVTTCEAIYMGVPVVVLKGAFGMARASYGILHTVGHPEWVTESKAEYVKLAVKLAQSLEQIKSLKLSLRQAVLQSPLSDSLAYTRTLEGFYEQCWQQYVSTHNVSACL